MHVFTKHTSLFGISRQWLRARAKAGSLTGNRASSDDSIAWLIASTALSRKRTVQSDQGQDRGVAGQLECCPRRVRKVHCWVDALLEENGVIVSVVLV